MTLEGQFSENIESIKSVWTSVRSSLEGDEVNGDGQTTLEDLNPRDELPVTTDSSGSAPSGRFLTAGVVLPNDRLVLYGGCGFAPVVKKFIHDVVVVGHVSLV